MTAPVVRPATSEDLPALQELFRQIGEQHAAAEPTFFRTPDPPLPPDYFVSLLADPEAAFLVAECDGVVAGALAMSLRRTPDRAILVPGITAHVSDLVVDAGKRRRGIGRALLRAAEAWAKENGATEMRLNVWEFNQGAQRFYEALGYRVAMRTMSLDLRG